MIGQPPRSPAGRRRRRHAAPAGAGAAGVALLLVLGVLPGCGDPPATRLLVIGVDGATWDVIDPLLAEGRLPAIGDLIHRGARGTIVASGVLKSPVIWTTVATGRQPEDHGIDDFLRDGVPVGSNLRRCPAVWNIVSDLRPELTVGVCGWYVTWPVEAIRGFMISDRLLLPELDNRYTPKDLEGLVDLERAWDWKDPAEADRLERFTSAPFRRGSKKTDLDDPDGLVNFLVDRRLALPYVRDETFARAAEILQRQRRPDLHMTYLIGVDFTSHGFWRDAYPNQFGDLDGRGADPRLAEIIPRYYEYIDEVIGRLVAAAGPETTVVVLSDHGFGAADRDHQMPPEYRYLTGNHRPEAIVIAAGPSIRQGAVFDEPTHLDMVPTALALLGVSPGREMTGRVWTEILEPAVADRIPLRRSRRYDEDWTWQPAPIASEADGEILTNLRALGYIPPEPRSTPVFADGFEGGSRSAWSSTR